MQWFTQMSIRYPKGCLMIECIDARRRLEELWDLSIPKEVSSEDIVDAGLLHLDLLPPKGAHFDNVLLEYFYHSLFTAKNFPSAKLCDLLTVYDSTKWGDNAKIQLVCRTYSKRLADWKTKATNSDLKRVIDLYTGDVDALKIQLVKYKILRSYKALGQKLMRDDFFILESLKPDLSKLSIDESSIKDIIIQITYILNEYQEPSNIEKMGALISNLSGYLIIEFETAAKILEKHPDWITIDIINALDSKFEAIEDLVGRRLKALKGRVQPPFPSQPEQTWDIEQMLSWATQSYLPYQSCALRTTK